GDGLRRDRPGERGMDERARRVGRARDGHLRALGGHDLRRRARAGRDRPGGARLRAAGGDGRVGGGVRAGRAGVRAARARGAAGGAPGADGRAGAGGGDEGEPDGAGVRGGRAKRPTGDGPLIRPLPTCNRSDRTYEQTRFRLPPLQGLRILFPFTGWALVCLEACRDALPLSEPAKQARRQGTLFSVPARRNEGREHALLPGLGRGWVATGTGGSTVAHRGTSARVLRLAPDRRRLLQRGLPADVAPGRHARLDGLPVDVGEDLVERMVTAA